MSFFCCAQICAQTPGAEAPKFTLQAGATQAQAVPAVTASPSNAARIARGADLAVKAQLGGHLPAWVKPANDTGNVSDDTALHLDFMLTRSPEIQAAFEQMLADQQDPSSKRFHVWMSPQQIGEQYGPAQADVEAITGWLAAQGLHVDEVTPSRSFIRVSATAAAVSRALATTFRMYTLADGKAHLSATSEPAIPAAFVPVIGAIAGLSQIQEEPMHRMDQVQSSVAGPNYTSSSTGNHYITPGDFATIYDVTPVYNSGINGAGQKVAIIGRSQVNPADITNYEASVGLGAKLENVVIPPLGIDPGITGTSDQGEATLDVERVLGTAPGAQADLVVSSSAGGGLLTAIQYNVQTLLDPIMTISFGSCEANAGQANVNLYTTLFSQAAAEGISVFVSAGDSGAAGCDTHGAAPPSGAQIASINYICSSGFATCVGGTEFAEGTNAASYWNTTNTSSRVSALSYIPEGVWNDPTSTTIPYIILSGGGGVSVYTAKPSFQTGTGVPADGFRDTPDMSFSGSGHDAYFGCYAQTGGGSCVVDPTTGSFSYVGFSGTSASAPSMAAVAALLNQKLGGPQGSLNPLLYRLAATPANGVYHDTTIATSGVSGCTAAIPSMCNNSTPSPTALTGGLAGYLLTTGYDLATGWGSMDVSKFLSTAAGSIATSTKLTGTTGTVNGTQTLSYSVVVSPASGTTAPTGSVQFYENGIAFGAVQQVTASASTAKASFAALSSSLANGTYMITAVYSGDSTYAASTSSALTITLTPPGTAPTTLSFGATSYNVTTTQSSTLTATVQTTGGGAAPTGTLSILSYNGTIGSTIYSVATVTGSTSVPFTFGTGRYILGASYSGDNTYAPSTSMMQTLNSSAAVSSTSLSGPATLTGGQSATLNATVTSLPVFSTTASVTFLDGLTVLGSTPLVKGTNALFGTASITTTSILLSGTHSITAVWGGDTNSLTSTSAPLLIAVTGPNIMLSPASPSLAFGAGAGTGNTDVVTLTSTGGFAGPVTVGCTVNFTGSGTAALSPTCSLSSSGATLTAGGTASTTVSLLTTAAHVKGASGMFAQGGQNLAVGGFFALLFACVPVASRTRTRFRSLHIVLLAFAAAGLLGMAGCGGGGSTGSTSSVGTTKGSYNVVVTAAGSGNATVNASTTITLNVQ